MRIVVANLPDDVSEEGIREALSPFAPVEKIKLVKESGTPSAVIEMEMTRPTGRSAGQAHQRAPVPGSDAACVGAGHGLVSRVPSHGQSHFSTA